MTPERDEQIMQVFLAAIELEGDRRRAYLDEACGADEALRAEVVSLLKYHAPDTLIRSDGAKVRSQSKPRSKLWPRCFHFGKTRAQAAPAGPHLDAGGRMRCRAVAPR